MVTATEVKVITKDEIDELILAQEAKAAAKKLADKADEDFKKQILSLFQKVFGVKTEAEMKRMSPEDIEMLFSIAKESLLIENGAAFNLKKTHESRNPQWKQEFIKTSGEAAAQEIINGTKATYSYQVVRQ